MGIILKFVSENAGISKTSQKPYHFVKFADPKTFENHTLTVDSSIQGTMFNLPAGQTVEVEGRLSTPFNNTQFVVTNIKPVKEA